MMDLLVLGFPSWFFVFYYKLRSEIIPQTLKWTHWRSCFSTYPSFFMTRFHYHRALLSLVRYPTEKFSSIIFGSHITRILRYFGFQEERTSQFSHIAGCESNLSEERQNFLISKLAVQIFFGYDCLTFIFFYGWNVWKRGGRRVKK